MKRFRSILILGVLSIGVALALIWILPLPAKDHRSAETLLRPGQELFYTEHGPQITMTWGSSSNPAIILIHGFGGNSYMWKPLGERLASRGFYVLAVDLKGFGITDKSWHDEYDHRSQAEWIAEIATRYEIDSARIVAHSMGANVALHLRALHPELASQIVFLAGAFEDPAPVHSILSWFLERATSRKGVQHIVRRWVTPDKIGVIFETASVAPEMISDDLRDSASDALMRADWDLALLKMIIERPKNAMEYIPEISLSDILFLWGDQDLWISPEVGERFRIRLATQFNAPLSEVPPIIVLPGAGHVVFLDQTEEVLEKITPFFSR